MNKGNPMRYLDAATARLHASNEFINPLFICSRSLKAEYEGWSNEATCLFNQYFMQEEKLQDALRALVNKQGTISVKRATNLFRNSGIRIDVRLKDEKQVNVREIIDDFLKAHREATNVKKS